MQKTPKQSSNSQPRYFLRYLSLVPVLAVLAISIAFTTWVLINTYAPDLLFFPE
jgi:photosystem I subunit IX